MAYDGSVELSGGLIPANGNTFPLVNASDVYVNDGQRLNEFISGIGQDIGSPNGLATLDENGKVPSSQLPSYVDDVLEYGSQSAFPATGETGKIYVAKDTNKTYRWSGSGYVVISETLALGETSSTAYRGDRGKTAYDHASAKGSAFTSGLYKIATNDQGHVTAAIAAGNTDIAPLVIDDNATGIPATTKTWSAQKSINELAKKVNDADLFAGIDIYDPNSASQGQFTFNVDAYAHQAGTKYIVHNTGDGVYVTPPESLENACLSYERYTLTEYIQHIADNTIDDTAGDGNTDKTWSADKIYDQLALKAPKASPEFTGSISLGRKTGTTIGDKSFAVGSNVEASGYVAHAEGDSTKSTEYASHAEGLMTKATGSSAHAEGLSTEAYGASSHAEGLSTKANGNNSHAEGENTIADGRNVHVFGICNVEDDAYEEWTANTEYHIGDKRSYNSNGYVSKYNHTSSTDFGLDSAKWNKLKGTSDYVEIVGNGTKNGAVVATRSNARTLDWDGNEWLAGNLTLGSTTLTEAKLQELINLTSATGVSF